MRSRSLTLGTCVLSVLGLVAIAAAPAAGEDAAPAVVRPESVAAREEPLARKPGAIIDASNIERYGDVGGPSIRWLVEHGVKLKIGAYRKVSNPPPLLEATRKYSAKVQLSADGTHLVDHVAGLPFPDIDTNDPQVATKLMFDFESAVARDDLDLRFIECRAGTIGSGKDPFQVKRTFLVDHFRRLYFRERTTVEPLPELASNRDAVRYKETLWPLIEPFDLKGTGVTMNRYVDPARQDDTWQYLPQLRRIRRISWTQRSEALFDQDIDLDSHGGFAGKIALYDWKYLGEKSVLATFHDATIPIEWGAAPGDYVHAASWEPRRVWVVEGVPKSPLYVYSDISPLSFAHSRRVFYIDRETFRIPYSDIYDRTGQLWKAWITSFLFAKAPIADTYQGDYEVPYEPSVTMVDMQKQHATFCELPSRRFPGERGWYANVGDKEGTTESAFELTVSLGGR
ncbi:MAG: DUF1329 domain-containing protein [Candidatus Binatia bacterium]